DPAPRSGGALRMKRSRIVSVALLSVLFSACGKADRSVAPPLGGGGSGGDDLIDAGDPMGPPPADAGGLCGNEFHHVVVHAPNIYFVRDASGSMALSPGSL